MTVLFHPEFAQDIARFETDYARVAPALAERFRIEIDRAIEAVTRPPGGVRSTAWVRGGEGWWV